MKAAAVLLICLGAALLPAPAGATIVNDLAATISPSQEVPPNSNPLSVNANGFATVHFDGSGNMVVNGFFSGLSSIFSSAGIYGPAFAGEIGNLFLPLTDVSSPGKSGTLSGVTSGISNPTETDFLNGQYYVEIFSVDFPDPPSVGQGGELRGQILPIPEPATFGLLGFGLAGIVYLARSRRAA